MTTAYGPAIRISMPFDRTRWPGQMEAVCRLIESAFPGNPLDCAIVMKGGRGEYRAIEDRSRYLRERVRNRTCSFTLNNHRSCVEAHGQIGPAYPGQMGLGGTQYAYDADGHYTLSIHMPPGRPVHSYDALTQAILQAIGPGCRLLG